MLPIILQHVREAVEVHVGGPEGGRHKVLTPFPPDSPDFADFDADSLLFGDPPTAADSASLDTVRALEFFNRTDSLYYDFGYGLRSDDYRLSQICQRFFLNAKPSPSDPSFTAAFIERKNAYELKYLRSTVGDLGLFQFRYTSLSPVFWSRERMNIRPAEVERLRTKTIALYQDLKTEDGDEEFIESLVEEVRSVGPSPIEYELGSFDVIREWMDPRLFDNVGWDFGAGNRSLYGEGDPTFVGNDVKLCYAERFYLVRNWAPGRSPAPAPPAGPPPIARDHRIPPVRPGAGRASSVRVGPVVLGRTSGGVRVGDRRREQRNVLITRRHRTAPTLVSAPPTSTLASDRYVWVPATATVPGHW
jgi:hypothetical protein